MFAKSNYLRVKQFDKKTINASFNNAIQDINNKLNFLFFRLYYCLFFQNVCINICRQKIHIFLLVLLREEFLIIIIRLKNINYR